MHKLMRVEPAPITRDEIQAYVEGAFAGFNIDVAPHFLERWQRVLEPERTLVVRDGGRIVAGASAFSRRLTIPGGETPVAAVTLVGVRPTHRRRGLLTTLMHRQLADVREREAVAVLWASESVIYGRFGYGMGTQGAKLEVDTRTVRLRARPSRQVDLLPPPDALDHMRDVYEQVRAALPGMLDRDGPWWDDRLRDHEKDRDGHEPLRAVVTEDAYALYAVKPHWGDRPAGEVDVREVIATTPESRATIWG
jgi:predicted acetyltransferase